MSSLRNVFILFTILPLITADVLFPSSPLSATQSNNINPWLVNNLSNNCLGSTIASFNASVAKISTSLNFYGFDTNELNSYGQVNGANITLVYVATPDVSLWNNIVVSLYDNCGNKLADSTSITFDNGGTSSKAQMLFGFGQLPTQNFQGNFQVRLTASRNSNNPGTQAFWNLKCLSVTLFTSTPTVLGLPCPNDTRPPISVSPARNRTNDSSNNGGKDNHGIIVGVVVGGVAVLAFVSGLTFVVIRKRKKSAIALPNNTESGNYRGSTDVNLSVISYGSNYSKSSIIRNDIYVDDVKLRGLLGKGKFGEVYEGLWHGTTAVACKKLKTEDQQGFENEIMLLMKLNHPNVVRCLGIYKHQPTGEVFMVLELLKLGSLMNFLRNSDSKSRLAVTDLVEICLHAASGMVFLEQKNIVHRDLGSRNLLVTESDGGYVVKIADFGLSRQMDENSSIYSSKEGVFPVKWSPPEVINFRQFTTKSDVWSFGITMWEIFEFGKVPYPSLNNEQAVEKVLQGYRLPKPLACPDEVYKIMEQCWASKPTDRPNFKWIYDQLEKIQFKLVEEEDKLKHVNGTSNNSNVRVISTRITSSLYNNNTKK